jgi:hypothetical protein
MEISKFAFLWMADDRKRKRQGSWRYSPKSTTTTTTNY